MRDTFPLPLGDSDGEAERVPVPGGILTTCAEPQLKQPLDMTPEHELRRIGRESSRVLRETPLREQLGPVVVPSGVVSSSTPPMHRTVDHRGGAALSLGTSDGEEEDGNEMLPTQGQRWSIPRCNHRRGEPLNDEASKHDVLTMEPLQDIHLDWTSPDGELRLCYNVDTVLNMAIVKGGRLLRPPHFREVCLPGEPWLVEVTEKLHRIGRSQEASEAQRGLARRVDQVHPRGAQDSRFQFPDGYLHLVESWGGKLGRHRLYACPICYETLLEECRRTPTLARGDDPDPLDVLCRAPAGERFAALLLFQTPQEVRAHLKCSVSLGGHGMVQREILPTGARGEDVTELLRQYALRGHEDNLVERWLQRGSQNAARFTRFVDYNDARVSWSKQEPALWRSRGSAVGGRGRGSSVFQSSTSACYWRSDGLYNTLRFHRLLRVVRGIVDGGGGARGFVVPGSSEARNFLPHRLTDSLVVWRLLLFGDASLRDDEDEETSEEMSGEMDALELVQPCVRAATMSDEESDECVVSGDSRLASYTQGFHEEVEAERRRQSSTLVLVRSRSGSRCRTRKKSRDSSCSSSSSGPFGSAWRAVLKADDSENGGVVVDDTKEHDDGRGEARELVQGA